MSRVIFERTGNFCARLGIHVPVLLAPMAGVPAPALSVAVVRAGGLGGCGVLMMPPADIADWSAVVRKGGAGAAFQLNTWIRDPDPIRDEAHETAVRRFLAQWGPEVPPEAGNPRLPDFHAQFDAMIASRPAVISSVMGLFESDQVAALKASGIVWAATVTTVGEARLAQTAGADVVIAQGAEAGGHRGSFDAGSAERRLVGGLALIAAVADAVDVPVVAAGGIGDGRGIVAALALGASAVQVGTAFLRAPEAGILPAWADAIGRAAPEDTVLTRAFSGRAGRSLATAYVEAAMSPDAPAPAPYPVQRGLTDSMRAAGARAGDVNRIYTWAGQAASLAKPQPAAEIVRRMWEDACALLG
jgi:nitronate monooxygenase